MTGLDTITLDLGNTALKLAAWQGDTIVERHRWSWRTQPEATWTTIADYLSTKQSPGASPSLNVGLCSVVPSQTNALINRLAPLGAIQAINPVSNPELNLGHYPPDQLGADRWVSALAASQLVPSVASIMIISMGTSTTIDRVVRHQGLTVYEGGAIMPGIKLFAQSLPMATDRLPETPFTPQPMASPGHNTLTCLQTGLSLGYTGLINAFITTWPSDAVVLTGGDAPLFAAMAVNPPLQGLEGWQYQPLLTHYGIRAAMAC
jgi:type III pantothenate kinase